MAWIVTRMDGPRRVRAALIVATALALPISMLLTRWPFRPAFYFSSAALNRLADPVEAGGKVLPTQWAGLYRVSGLMIFGGDTALIIDPSSGGMSAFVRKSDVSADDWRGVIHLYRGRGERWHYLDED